MKILQLNECYESVGGTEQYLISLSESLEQLGHTVSVIFGRKINQALSYKKRNEYFLPALINREGEFDKETQIIIDDIITKNNPDIIYIHNVHNFNIVKRLAELRPTIRFVHDHRLFCPKEDKLFRFSRNRCDYPCGFSCVLNTYLGRCLNPLPNIVLTKLRYIKRSIEVNKKIQLIVASKYMKNCLIKNGFSPLRIEILPYFCNFLESKERYFNDFVLFVGRIVSEKGLQYLVRSIKDWPEGLRLVVAGEGSYLTCIKKMSERMGLSHKIDLLGSIPNSKLQYNYERCLVLAIPSVWDEPFGIAGLEAMFCGKPVVAFNVGGISDWIKDGINGFLVKRKDIHTLTEKIKYFFYNKEKAQLMGKKGEEIYHNNLTKERHITRLLEIFNTQK